MDKSADTSVNPTSPSQPTKPSLGRAWKVDGQGRTRQEVSRGRGRLQLKAGAKLLLKQVLANKELTLDGNPLNFLGEAIAVRTENYAIIIERLVQIIEDKDSKDSDAIDASRELMNRGTGKAIDAGKQQKSAQKIIVNITNFAGKGKPQTVEVVTDAEVIEPSGGNTTSSIQPTQLSNSSL